MEVVGLIRLNSFSTKIRNKTRPITIQTHKQTSCNLPQKVSCITAHIYINTYIYNQKYVWTQTTYSAWPYTPNSEKQRSNVHQIHKTSSNPLKPTNSNTSKRTILVEFRDRNIHCKAGTKCWSKTVRLQGSQPVTDPPSNQSQPLSSHLKYNPRGVNHWIHKYTIYII